MYPEWMRDRRIVHSPARRLPAKMRKLSVDGIDQPHLVEEDPMYSPERPRLEKRCRLSSDGIDQPTNVCIVGGVKDRRVVRSSSRPPPEKSRRMYSHAAWAPVTFAWQDLVEDLAEDPWHTTQKHGFCGRGAWIPNKP